jgi:hypothetical protein
VKGWGIQRRGRVGERVRRWVTKGKLEPRARLGADSRGACFEASNVSHLIQLSLAARIMVCLICLSMTTSLKGVASGIFPSETYQDFKN